MAQRNTVRYAFTLVELLVVVSIIIVLLAFMITTMTVVRAQAQTAICASNLRQIGAMMLTYTNNYNGRVFNERDYCRWTDPATPTNQIDPFNWDAYWGVAYARYGGGQTTLGGAQQKAFYCPAAHALAGSGTDIDGSFANGFVYFCYGLNGYGARWSGFSAAQRLAILGSTANQCALFTENPAAPVAAAPGSVEWTGRSIINTPNSARLILAQDGYESVIDGNGDTFYNWYQWTPPNHSPDESSEYLRHANRSNAVFADGHVGALSRLDQTNVNYYTGRW